jgi:ribosomal protein L11 methylase PrmA
MLGNHREGRQVIFDVGANAGIYSLAALAIQRDATVHAFEPTRGDCS